MSNDEQGGTNARRLKLQALRQRQKEKPVIEGQTSGDKVAGQRGRLLKAVLKKRRDQQADGVVPESNESATKQFPRLREIMAKRKQGEQGADSAPNIELLGQRVSKLEAVLHKAKQQLDEARKDAEKNDE